MKMNFLFFADISLKDKKNVEQEKFLCKDNEEGNGTAASSV